MKPCLFVAIALLSVSAVPAAAVENAAAVDNAALLYWQAFHALPKPNKAETPDEVEEGPVAPRAELPEDPWGDPLTPELVDLAARGRYSLMLLQRAAQIETCDWALPWDQGPALLMPHMALARSLARLGCLKARISIGRGDTAGAMEQLLAVMALARHTGPDAAFIGLLVQISIEDLALRGFAEHYGQWTPADRTRWRRGVAALPEGATLPKAIESERGWLTPVVRQMGATDEWDAAIDPLLTACDPVVLKALGFIGRGQSGSLADRIARIKPEHYALLRQAAELPADRDEFARLVRGAEAVGFKLGHHETEEVVYLLAVVATTKRESGRTTAEVLTDMDRVYDELDELAALPLAESLPRWKRWDAGLEQSPLLVRKLAPRLSHACTKPAEARTRLALSLKETVPAPDGNGDIVLTSDLEIDGKLVTLVLRTGGVDLPATSAAAGPPANKVFGELLRELRAFAKMSPAKQRQAVRGDLLGELGKELDALDDATRQKVLDVFVDSAEDLAVELLALLNAANEGDPSAMLVATIVTDADELWLPLYLRRTLTGHGDKLRALMGPALFCKFEAYVEAAQPRP